MICWVERRLYPERRAEKHYTRVQYCRPKAAQAVEALLQLLMLPPLLSTSTQSRERNCSRSCFWRGGGGGAKRSFCHAMPMTFWLFYVTVYLWVRCGTLSRWWRHHVQRKMSHLLLARPTKFKPHKTRVTTLSKRLFRSVPFEFSAVRMCLQIHYTLLSANPNQIDRSVVLDFAGLVLKKSPCANAADKIGTAPKPTLAFSRKQWHDCILQRSEHLFAVHTPKT